jgi:hypothetical protein
MTYPQLKNVALLIDAFKRSNPTDKKSLTIWSHLHHLTGNAVISFQEKDNDWRDQILTVEYALERFLKPALVSDPTMIKFDKDKLEKHYNVFGHDVKFKVDTGAVTNVIDAKADWKCADEDLDLYAAAYKEYVEIHPDDGAMRQEDLKELSEKFHNLDFGTVNGFDFTVHRKGKDSDEGQSKDKQKKSKVVKIDGPFKVVGISSPTKDSKKGDTPFPVIDAVFEDPDSGQPIETTIALKSRNMTTRGLLSRIFVNSNDVSLEPESKDIRIIDLTKVDLDAVQKALQPVFMH